MGRWDDCFFLLLDLPLLTLLAHHMLHLTLMFSVSATSCIVSDSGSKIVTYQMVAKQGQAHPQKDEPL